MKEMEKRDDSIEVHHIATKFSTWVATSARLRCLHTEELFQDFPGRRPALFHQDARGHYIYSICRCV
jgi:hypothetical protein